ncbi:hypothetical protein GUITHDRAFT_117729 [Guillardia theta CCMP2712]|uniref:Uncharacterized protein n=1 Tax=Guillardia theta (strain CCMP2712) TaxID=905079 RepID=L1IIY3_GUITC|nr:hypothetical protein GUITHDRAFT_117729 [Guillardia theta CCMP2712]EKX36062.1 hypothetical protein GUITHDRAFT_117729 [Guillardia theta CCMP2712]|eukprot:XP_005823042.1 hypothetical protein GUITHDRAFT_117729 [Guillardia theta CCMP2712]
MEYLVITFDAKGGIQQLPNHRTCLRLVNPQQGGYNAFILEPHRMSVEFVLLTKANVHPFKLTLFAEALTGLGILAAGWKSFRIGKITGCGALEKYGWKRGHEERQAEVAVKDVA